MYIGSQLIHIYLPGVRTLKEKRKYLNSIKDRLKKNLNLSVSEINYQHLVQRCELGICGVCRDRNSLEQLFQKAAWIMQKYPRLAFTRGEVNIEKKQTH